VLHLHSPRLLGKRAQLLLDLNRINGNLAGGQCGFQQPVWKILCVWAKVLITDVNIDGCDGIYSNSTFLARNLTDTVVGIFSLQHINARSDAVISNSASTWLLTQLQQMQHYKV
jgi:hypothetical protein